MAEGLLLVGCGKMGAALLAGWVRRRHRADPIVVVEPKPAPGAIPAAAA